MKFKRIFLLVLDSLGVGASTDANLYNDKEANTLGHINETHPLFIPNLNKLGFLDTITLNGNKEVDAYYTYAKPNNVGKDSLQGHYELMGIRNNVAFKNFNEGFPRELIDEIEKSTGRRIIGNKMGDADEIVRELGKSSEESGSLILFTSDDSNLQLAGEENTVPLAKLYSYCEKVRKLTMREEYRVGRVIARPFIKRYDTYMLTKERKDYAIKPPKKGVLDFLDDHDFSVISIGKINDIFDREGVNKVIKSTSNKESMNRLLETMDKDFTGLCFVNLGDFDSLGGHKSDPNTYATLIEEFDVDIPILLNKLNKDDLLIITADHGNDPTYKGGSHTRENVPAIFYSRSFKEPKPLEPLESLADIGATIADNFDVEEPEIGVSVLEELI